MTMPASARIVPFVPVLFHTHPAAEDLTRRLVPESVLRVPGHEVADLRGGSRRQGARGLGRTRPAEEVVQAGVLVSELLDLAGDVLEADAADEHIRGEVVAE